MLSLDVSTFGYLPKEWDAETQRMKGKIVNEVIITHPNTVDIGARVRLVNNNLIVEQWRNIDERLDILGDERLRD